jgi:hypothetical protein
LAAGLDAFLRLAISASCSATLALSPSIASRKFFSAFEKFGVLVLEYLKARLIYSSVIFYSYEETILTLMSAVGLSSPDNAAVVTHQKERPSSNSQPLLIMYVVTTPIGA